MSPLQIEELAGVMFAHFPDCGIEADADSQMLRVLPTGKSEEACWSIPMSLPVEDVSRECVIYMSGFYAGKNALELR